MAQHLCQIGQFTVPLGRQQVPLRVSPYVSGEIQKAMVSGGWGLGSIYLPNTCQGRFQGPQTSLAYTATFPGLPDPSHVFMGYSLF